MKPCRYRIFLSNHYDPVMYGYLTIDNDRIIITDTPITFWGNEATVLFTAPIGNVIAVQAIPKSLPTEETSHE